MSTWFEESVCCPLCSLEQNARLAKGLHVARAPEVRDQIFARTLHAITCRGCSSVFVVQRPLIYTDMERKHWLQVVMPDERIRWPEYERAVDAIYDRAFTGSPLARELSERMRIRLVFGLEELREKLVLWAANLDDRAIECMKLDLVRREPALARSSLLVDSVSTTHALVRVDGSRVIEIDRSAVEQFDADTRLPARFPELFGGRYVALDRLLGPRYRWAEPSR
jgi:CpXC protein